MQIDVGSAINYKGRVYICIAVEQFDVKELAKEDSATTRNYFATTENVRALQMEIDVFSIGDVIHKTGERITLECPGVDISFIWTAIRIQKKESQDNGTSRVEDGVGESSDNKVEGPRPGDSGGEGIGPANPGEVGS